MMLLAAGLLGWRGRPAQAGAGGMPGPWASMPAMSRGAGLAGRMARPRPGATGARLALPILARMMELIPPAPLPGLRPRPQRPVMAQATDRLRLLFPPPGAVVELGGLVLRAAGGH